MIFFYIYNNHYVFMDYLIPVYFKICLRKKYIILIKVNRLYFFNCIFFFPTPFPFSILYGLISKFLYPDSDEKFFHYVFVGFRLVSLIIPRNLKYK